MTNGARIADRTVMRAVVALLAGGLVVGVAPNLRAQVASTRSHTVQGIVFDSVAGAPLAGAQLQLAARVGNTAPYTAATDSAGAFRISGVSSGEYLIGFYHDQLTSLGLDAPTRFLDLRSDSVVTVDLAIPSSRTVRALRCGAPPNDQSDGMLVGHILSSANGVPVPGVDLALQMSADSLDLADRSQLLRSVQSQLEADGTLLVCQLPISRPLEVDVSAPGFRRLRGPIGTVPSNGIGRLELYLVDSSARVGDAQIRGHVAGPSGAGILSGRVIIPALGRETSLQNGRFSLDSIPRGTWAVEIRAIGHTPSTTFATATDGTAPYAEMRLGEPLERLEAVTVIGQRAAGSSLLDAILRRQRLGMGTVFLPDSPALKSATFTSDVMKEARGFAYQGRASITGRATKSGVRCGFVAVYLDGLLQPGGFEEIDSVVHPNQVLAIETFPDIRLAPVQYRSEKFVLGTTNVYCALVLVWTRFAK
ncbi:MAG: carboxypeptidase-like regulatory domain-containing protein [Gemmatimonadaceae bacterium]